MSAGGGSQEGSSCLRWDRLTVGEDSVLPRFEIRPARPEEAGALSALAIRSKAHWGYDDAQMDVFRGELTLTAADLVDRSAAALEVDGQVVGFYTLAPHDTCAVELEHLFVEPEALRRGHGRRLLDHAVATAADAGHGRLIVQSDPNAEGFYVRAGARLVKRIPSSIPGRSIPFFELALV